MCRYNNKDRKSKLKTSRTDEYCNILLSTQLKLIPLPPYVHYVTKMILTAIV